MRMRHFLIYYDNRTKEITKTTPRTWAKSNQGHFPTFTFIDRDVPKDNRIERYLTDNYGFMEEEHAETFKLLYNFNPAIPAYNGLNFIL